MKNEKTNQLVEDSLVPIVIGVIGHRDLVPGDLNHLRNAIMAELDKIKLMCQGCNIVMISALAEGADRLAAEVAIDRGINLLAVLPMPQNEYEKDFSELTSLVEFRALLQKTVKVIELPLLDKQLQPVSSLTQVDRVLQYEQLGLYISSNCHVLIALWDGEESSKRGGTANVVNMRRGIPGPANPTVLYSHSSLPIGYTVQIVTPRQSHLHVQGQPYTSCPVVPVFWKPDERAERILRKILRNTVELNKDIRIQTRDHQWSVDKSREQLFKNPVKIPKEKTLSKYIVYYSWMDSLANRFKSQRVNTITFLFALIVLMFIWFEFHIEFLPNIKGFPQGLTIWGYVVPVSLIIMIYARAKVGRFEEKHEDYRVLAEALRVQIAWRLSGMSESVADNCIPRQVGELSWIRLALFGWTFPNANVPTLLNPDFDNVRFEWVEGQEGWYNDKSGKNAVSAKQITTTGATLLALSAVMALVLCFHALYPHVATEGLPFWVSKALIATTVTLLAIAAARHGFAEKMAWAEQAYQYDRMGKLFSLANKTLEKLLAVGHSSDTQQIMFTLGKEAMAEHGDWLIMHRARPLEVPRL